MYVRTYVHAYPNSYFPLIASYVLVNKNYLSAIRMYMK